MPPGAGWGVVAYETRAVDLALQLERGVRSNNSTGKIRTSILKQPKAEMGNAMAARFGQLNMRQRSDRRIAGEFVEVLRKMSGKRLGFDLSVAKKRSPSRSCVREMRDALKRWTGYFAEMSARSSSRSSSARSSYSRSRSSSSRERASQPATKIFLQTVR